MGKIIHVVASDLDSNIGLNGGLPWPHCREDMKHFAEVTKGKHVVFGRTTYEGLPKSFKAGDRTIHVLGGGTSVQDVLDVVGDNDLYVCGGAKTYAVFPEPDEIYLTIFMHKYEGDTKYPVEFVRKASSRKWDFDMLNTTIHNDHKVQFRHYEGLNNV